MGERRSLEQRLAELDAKRARLAARKRSIDTRQKILVGAAMIAAAMEDHATAHFVRDVLGRRITREIDKRALAELIARLGDTTPPSTPPTALATDLERAAMVTRRPGR